MAGYEVGSEEQPKIYAIENVFSGADMDELIWAAYRQIFSEHQSITSNRQTFLESQLRYGQISVKDFIRGLATSDSFRRLNLEPNSNYRFVDICVQRILGRDVYSDRERIAWSILLPTKGLQGFIDALVDSDEYANNFGDNTVPFQLRRILPQRAKGETPFNLKTPRYEAYHRSQLGFPQTVWQNAVRRFKPQETKVGAGNPQGFLGMARAVTPSLPVVARTPLANINIATAVPYRKR
ncbi:MAG TPA: phycobilisome rod-core linker polypeptide [Coleofasciculaceae cyanobacterium]